MDIFGLILLALFIKIRNSSSIDEPYEYFNLQLKHRDLLIERYFEFHNQIRLMNSYKSEILSLSINQEIDCFINCLKDLDCVAVTYDYTNLAYETFECFYFGYNYISSVDDKFRSILKVPYNAKPIFNTLILNSTYHINTETAFDCFKICNENSDCKGISFQLNLNKICYLILNYFEINNNSVIYSNDWNTYFKIEPNQPCSNSSICINQIGLFCDKLKNMCQCKEDTIWEVNECVKYKELRNGIRLINDYKSVEMNDLNDWFQSCFLPCEYIEKDCVAVTVIDYYCYMYNDFFKSLQNVNYISVFKRSSKAMVRVDNKLKDFIYSNNYDSAYQCFNECLNDSECNAISFENVRNGQIECFFHSITDTTNLELELDIYKNWITYYKKIVLKKFGEHCMYSSECDSNVGLFCNRQTYLCSCKDDQIWNKKFCMRYFEIRNGIKLINSYKFIIVYKYIDVTCMRLCEQDDECVAVSFNIISSDILMANCSMFRNDFKSQLNSSFKSFIKSPPHAGIKQNLKYSNFYKFSLFNTGLECYLNCLKEFKCRWISFKSNSNTNEIDCYFYTFQNSALNDKFQHEGWISYLKLNRMQIY